MKKRTKKLLPARRVALVLNNQAGTLLGDAHGADRLGAALEAAGFDIVDVPHGTLPERLQRAREADADMVVVAGGDGTVACAAQALAGTDIALGIIPAGTANLLAKDLGIPADDADAAVAIITGGVKRDIDVAEIDGQMFLCAAMFGSPARLGHHREEGRRRGNGFLGWLHLARAMARAARRHRARSLAVTVDGVRHRVRTPSLTVVVNALDDSTGRLFGRSCLDSGTLSVYATRHRSVGAFVRLLINTLRGRFTSDPEITMFRGRAVRVDSKDAALRVLVDGEERLLPTPVSMRVSERTLTVITAQ